MCLLILEFVAEAGPGDFIYVPPYVPHQEINAAPDEPLECVLVRSDQEAVVVNLAIEPAEPPSRVTGRTEVFPPPAGVAITYTRHAKSSVPSKETAMLPEAFVKSTKLAPSPYGARLGSLFVLAGTATLTG